MESPQPSIGAIIVCEIAEADLGELAAFLARGFGYPTTFYQSLFDKLRRRATPDTYPKFGYALKRGGRIFGAILLIFTQFGQGADSFVRCHVTSWFVEPEFRPLASVFFARGLKRKDVTYINVSAREWTRPIVERQGFSCYSAGQFTMSTLVNALMVGNGAGVRVVAGGAAPQENRSDFERKLMSDHAGYGCICVWCVTGDAAYPFVFHPEPVKRIVPCAQLVYCSDIDSFFRFAGPLGRYLLARGKLLVRVDANGPPAGLPGRYSAGLNPRWFKGARPRQGDLAYTQLAMCPFAHARFGEEGT